jgi:hypothetical protein
VFFQVGPSISDQQISLLRCNGCPRKSRTDIGDNQTLSNCKTTHTVYRLHDCNGYGDARTWQERRGGLSMQACRHAGIKASRHQGMHS